MIDKKVNTALLLYLTSVWWCKWSQLFFLRIGGDELKRVESGGFIHVLDSGR